MSDPADRVARVQTAAHDPHGAAGPAADPTSRGDAGQAGRHGLVGQVLAAQLAALDADALARGTVTVLDCGGGSGSFAVPLASAGAHVTVVDISVDALATLRRRADESGVADSVTGVAGDVDALGEAVAAETFDLVLAHGILEALDDPESAFTGIARAVRPGGLLSVLVTNPVAAVIARALAGDLAGARRELAAIDGGRLTPQRVQALCAVHHLTVEQTHGLGVFADIVPGAALDATGARGELAALETECAQRSPFADIAGRVHVLARRG